MSTESSGSASGTSSGPISKVKRLLPHRIEDALSFSLLILIAVLPLLEAILRRFHTGIPHMTGYLQHLVLWISLIGGMITSREKRHLALTAGVERIGEPFRAWIQSATGFLSIALSLALCLASLSFALIGFDPDQKVGAIPVSLLALVMPLGFGVIAVRFITRLERGIRRLLPAAAHEAGRLLLSLAAAAEIGGHQATAASLRQFQLSQGFVTPQRRTFPELDVVQFNTRWEFRLSHCLWDTVSGFLQEHSRSASAVV